ncbi:MAG: hypothetical protein V4511_03000 [Bacteroidota bacterium]
MKDKDTYFNFPICLISGIFEDKMKVLNNILDYTVYAKAVSLKEGPIRHRIGSTLKYFGVESPIQRFIGNGEDLYASIPQNSPKASIKKDLYFDFYTNDKSEFEIVTLCSFLAIRSILLFKPYCKVTDSYLLNRMAGQAAIKELEHLPEPLKKYTKVIEGKWGSNQYHLNKIKKELRHNWKLKVYGKHTRGFYVSFDLELTDLIFEVEKKRKKHIEKNYQSTEADARKAALQRLYEPKATPEFVNYTKAKLKDKPDGDYNMENISKEDMEAIKYIIKKKLLPEIELSLSPDFKSLILRHCKSNGISEFAPS